jgi:GGDEF domain-containing protein
MVGVSARDLVHNVNEIVAELLMLAVLAAAVHFGRKGGFVASLGASAIYVMLSVPVMGAEQGLTSHTLLLIVLRISTFGLIGIVGGEACNRLRYILTRYANAETFDEWSQVFNQTYAHNALLRAMASSERYGQQFTLVVLTLAPAITSNLGPQRVRTLVRSVSAHLRGDLRMVDEIARLDDGRYLVLLPNTPIEGGQVVAARLADGVRQLLGSREESVTTRSIYSVDDTPALVALAAEIGPEPSDVDDQPASGAYNSAGASERKPALDSASSAPGASTLKMSTAAAPDGSTKQ